MLRRTLIHGFCVSALALLAACGGPDTPEDQVRARIRAAATAVEDKQIGTLREMISERYVDERRQDKRGVEAVLRYHFLRNAKIHLFTHVKTVTVHDPAHATATVLVAMAGVPIPTAADLPALRADLHYFEVEFVLEEESWRVAAAAWRRADPAEFVGL